MPRLTFDFPSDNGAPQRRVFRRPREVLCAERVDDVLGVLRAVEQATAEGAWAAGFIAYEAAPAFEPAMAVSTRRAGRMPLAWFGIFDGCETAAPGRRMVAGPPLPAFEVDTSPAQYRNALAAIHRAILDGETYQVNYTTRLRATLASGFDIDALYGALCAAQGAGYHADIDVASSRILSATPELFFQRRGRRITTRPMKGTRPRGRFGAEDDALARELAASPKEQAENLMIVDLLRNDLGRIAQTGSVRVPDLFTVERYRTVLQLTSTVEAELEPECGLVDIFTALFPCGSVTGAPKINTMRIIDALETDPRGVYCGAIGLVEPGGDCTFSVPIRTLTLDRDTGVAEYGVGSGITADSTTDAEDAELQAKAMILQTHWPAFSLIETLRLESGTLVRLERHLARLAASCAYFDRPFPGDALRRALSAVAGCLADAQWRVRVELGDDGRFTIAVEPFETRAASELAHVAIAAEAVNARDVFLFHKTTHRDLHERTRRATPHAFDVLLCNERGEVTEFTRGNVVVQLDGELRTPPVTAGLLAGCLRAELLEAGTIVERTVQRAELARAERIWFVNSLRGWVEVRLPPDEGASARLLASEQAGQ